MKFTIEGFNQQVLVDSDLDYIHALLLRWFVDFLQSGRMSSIIKDDKQFFWVDYQTIIMDLPIMGIQSKDRIYRKLKQLVEKGFLEHHTIKGKINIKGQIKSGTFSYYAIGHKYINLINSVVENNVQGTVKKPEGYGEKTGTKTPLLDSSINNSFLKEKILAGEELKNTVQKYLDDLKINLSVERFSTLLTWFERRVIDRKGKCINTDEAIKKQINRLKKCLKEDSFENIMDLTTTGNDKGVYEKICVAPEWQRNKKPSIVVNESNQKKEIDSYILQPENQQQKRLQRDYLFKCYTEFKVHPKTKEPLTPQQIKIINDHKKIAKEKSYITFADYIMENDVLTYTLLIDQPINVDQILQQIKNTKSLEKSIIAKDPRFKNLLESKKV